MSFLTVASVSSAAFQVTEADKQLGIYRTCQFSSLSHLERKLTFQWKQLLYMTKKKKNQKKTGILRE